ncbi:MAG TPA: hypothetical protein VGF75_03380 [Candidatus Saccharimonadales bacterium]|jgi:hypothetical protein
MQPNFEYLARILKVWAPELLTKDIEDYYDPVEGLKSMSVSRLGQVLRDLRIILSKTKIRQDRANSIIDDLETVGKFDKEVYNYRNTSGRGMVKGLGLVRV